MGEERRPLELYNSPIEVGLRCLMIIKHKRSVSLEQLIIYDYLCLNTHDFNGPQSLHAAIPHRSVQVYVRREIIKKGLKLLISKELATVKGLKSGINYRPTKLTPLFLEHLTSEYKSEYEEKLKWVLKEFGQLSETKLRKVINSNMESWGGELETESNYIN
jgi:hypothetical protein